ncbi:Poly(ADP-ribose) glycohydrolase 1, partial [Bienertia sinuspersici]
CLYEDYRESLEHKIKCIVHYFERIHSCVPKGFVSFERKVLPLEHNPSLVSYPTADFWANSVIPLCLFEVANLSTVYVFLNFGMSIKVFNICSTGLIEDQSSGALEVDFANKYLGGGALSRGMLFLPSMSDNEAIEIVGAERFSNYSGYASTFRHTGNHVDVRDVDSLGRRKTKIVAIDALCSPGLRQYRVDCLLREVNKAFCGFLDQHKDQQYHQILWQCHDSCKGHDGNDSMDIDVSEIQTTLSKNLQLLLNTKFELNNSLT